MRGILLGFADHFQQILDGSDTTLSLSMTELPDDLWDVSVGVFASSALYQHAVRAMTAQVLFRIWDGLGIGNLPDLPDPFTPGQADHAFPAIYLN